MSGRVPIRVPTGSPANAFLSRPAPPEPPAEVVAPAPTLEPPLPAKPSAATVAHENPSTAVAAGTTPGPHRPESSRAQRVEEPGVRFQFFLPASLARLVDAERDRRRASGYGGRGKSDYTAIFRDLVEKHLR